jgi:hypothetical protein
VSPRFRQLALSRGSAAAEFVMVGALLVALGLGVIHATLIVHVRHVLQASAWEGARVASYWGSTPADGARFTRSLIEAGLQPSYARDIEVREVDVAGRPGVEVRVRAPLPALGLWSLGGEIRVEAAVPREIPG